MNKEETMLKWAPAATRLHSSLYHFWCEGSQNLKNLDHINLLVKLGGGNI